MENSQRNNHQTKLFAKKDCDYQELTQLQRTIQQIAKSNQIKYQNILKTEPLYSCQLYVPNQFNSKEKAFKKQLYLRQLDHLLEQQGLFNKKIARLDFKKQQQINHKEKYFQSQVNHYAVLRTVWSKYHNQKQGYKESIQKIQNLNCIVGMVKNSIQNMIKAQNSCLSKEVKSQKHSDNISLSNQQKLKVKMERSLMKNQEFRNKLILIEQKLSKKEEIILELEQKIEKLEKQNNNLKTLNENQLINYKNKLSQLNQKSLLLQKTIDNLTQSNTSFKNYCVKNNQNSFKLYFDLLTQKKDIFQKQIITNKNFQQIIQFLKQKEKKNQPRALQDQQNAQLMIPTLSFSSNMNNKQIKSCTDRPLKLKRNQIEKFFKPNDCFKYNKIQSILNDQSCKKFVRKSQILSSSRKMHVSQFIEDQSIKLHSQQQKE